MDTKSEQVLVQNDLRNLEVRIIKIFFNIRRLRSEFSVFFQKRDIGNLFELGKLI